MYNKRLVKYVCLTLIILYTVQIIVLPNHIIDGEKDFLPLLTLLLPP
jgi:hypothetical protein